MTETDRREVLKWSAAGAIATLTGFASASSLSATERLVSAPQGALSLTRKVIRELGPQAKIVVNRTWEISFDRFGKGWMVAGRQVDVSVEAPPRLAALARMEERRPVPESFPIELDHNGLILRSNGPIIALDLERAAHEAELALASMATAPRKSGELRNFVSRLQMSASSLISRFPHDLFFPLGESSSTSRNMDLPGGVIGHLQVDYAADTYPDSELLHASQRIVTTTAGSETMRSIEEWNLQSA